MCTTCNGSGRAPCTECQNTGKTTCLSCNGNGWSTHIYTVKLFLTPKSKTLYNALDGDVRIALARFESPDLVKTGDMTVSVLSDTDARPLRGLLKTEEPALTALYYRAHMPVGRLTIKMGKTTISPLCVGYHVRLTDCATFLDRLLTPALKSLQAAQQGGHDCADHLKSALRYRLVQTALSGLSKVRMGRVAQTLLKTYPVGLSERFLKALLPPLAASIGKLSFWPNLIGIALALVITTFLSDAYLYFGGKVAIMTHFGLTPPMTFVPDVAALILIALIQLWLGRYAGRVALRRTMAKLNLSHIKTATPPAGPITYAGLMICVLVFAILYFAPVLPRIIGV